MATKYGIQFTKMQHKFQLVLTSIPIGGVTFLNIWMKSIAFPESLLVTTTTQFFSGTYTNMYCDI